MKKFHVTGMSCAACSARVENAVSSLSGVELCSVNLLTETMLVEGSISESEVISAVVEAGYSAEIMNSEIENKAKSENGEYDNALKRLISSAVILFFLMIFSMGHMLRLPLPEILIGNSALNGAIQMVLSTVILIINKRFFVNGFKGIIHRSPNMDTLVSLGSGVAFVYSAYVLLDSVINSKPNSGYYFESAAMILTLITVGKMLEARSKGKTADAVKALMKLAPETAHVIRNGKETIISSKDIVIGDIFIVRPGESIPADGEIIEGEGEVNESALTGESIPCDKTVGNGVSAGTVNGSAMLKCKATKTSENTFLSQIIKAVGEATATKAPISRIADKVSAVFVPIVIGISALTLVLWLASGKDIGFSVARAISVLVISCPCSLGLATPVAIMVASGVGAKNGILFKNATSLEQSGKIKTVIFDKTGTLTKGDLSVTDIVTDNGFNEVEFLKIASGVENASEHPVALAVVEQAKKRGIEAGSVEAFRALPGNGVEGEINGKKITAGKPSFMKRKYELSSDIISAIERCESEGKTVLVFSYEEKIIGIIALSDTVREESVDAVNELRKMNIKTVMLTGDNSVTASVIAGKVGIDEVKSNLLPNEKEERISEYMQSGKTAMVGDGINDAPALARADLGIAIGAGTDIAIDCADIVLMNSRPTDVSGAIRLGRESLKNIKENLFWAFFYNIIGIPIAAGILIEPFGIELNPMIAAAAMSLSSFCVVTNALRLNKVKIHHNKNKEEVNKMTKTIRIDGMMCAHCEARVKTALEALNGVDVAEVSHEKSNAVLTLSRDVPFEVLKETVERQGYKVK